MTVKRVSFFLFFFLTLTIPQDVFAQSTTSAALNTKGANREQLLQTRQQMQQARLTTKENMREERASMSATLKEERLAFIQNIQQIRQNAETQIKAEREAFQEKLATIKDTRRKMLVDQIQTKLSSVSANRTNAMSENLQKLSTILENIQNRANTAKANGKDTSAVDAAIVNAQTAIQKAQAAVTTQSGKTYIITITATSSAGLKAGVGIKTKEFRTDITAAYQLMVAAKKAVNQAYLALAKVIGTPKEPTSTSSALPIAQ